MWNSSAHKSLSSPALRKQTVSTTVLPLSAPITQPQHLTGVWHTPTGTATTRDLHQLTNTDIPTNTAVAETEDSM